MSATAQTGANGGGIDMLIGTHAHFIGAALFFTQGDANEVPDGSSVHYKNIIGKPVFSVPYLGYVSNYIQNPPGMYVAIAGCALLMILVFLPDIFSDDEEEEKKKIKPKH